MNVYKHLYAGGSAHDSTDFHQQQECILLICRFFFFFFLVLLCRSNFCSQSRPAGACKSQCYVVVVIFCSPWRRHVRRDVDSIRKLFICGLCVALMISTRVVHVCQPVPQKEPRFSPPSKSPLVLC